MAQIVLMPKEGITVESCLVGAWRKNVGDAVALNEPLFEYETDKAAFECVSTADGVLLHKFYEEGDEAPVLKPVAIVGEAGEDISALIATAGAASEPTAPASETAEEASLLPLSVPNPEPYQSAPPSTAKEELTASPRARSFAAERGVDLRNAVPTGPDGRILEADVVRAANAAYAGTAEAQETSAGMNAASAPTADYTDEAFTKIRAAIAKSMTASLHTGAQLTHHHSFDATNVLAMREDFKNSDEALGYRGVSVGDIILYVTSRALAGHPEINALVSDTGVRKYHTVNLGVAVDTPRGLMVPTVFGAEKKSLKGISAEVKALAAAAREGRINPDFLAGGTFTVSNLGATGVEVFTPIINPPQAAIAGICGATERVRRGRNGRPEIYPSIGISLTYDHRAIDGAPASRFAAELCKALEAFSWRTIALEFESATAHGGNQR
ncbi:MAG: 2-oxo acid dehydrogenase subunit E2 [Clostridiales bacterium]|nr:2-oxo acid dehydrogenase subunit E2 [Clostridiales bacterium]